MGQLLLVQGPDRAAVDRLFSTAIGLFRSTYDLTPSDVEHDDLTAAARFPRWNAAVSRIVRSLDGAAWICGSGGFFHSQPGADPLSTLLDQLPRVGEAAITDINGMFAIARHDTRTGTLDVITDRVGTLHIFKADIGPCVVISTSTLVLAALKSADWDPVSCREFLATGTVFENRSLFAGVEKLAPGTICRFRKGREVSRTRYWNPAAFRYSCTDSIPQLTAALEDAVRTVKRNFARPVMDVTGGFDSRVLVGAAIHSHTDVDTFVAGEETDPDVIVSKNIAGAFDLRHHRLRAEVAPIASWNAAKAALLFCDGEMDVFEYGRILQLQRPLSGMFDVEVNGSNGELCKGYWWELLFPFTGRRGHFNAEAVAAKRIAFGGEPVALLRHRFPNTIVQHFADVIRTANAGLERHPNTAQMDNVYLMLRMQRWQGRIASAGNRLWPSVSPFMFREPMEIALGTPSRKRVRNRLTRNLIEHLSPALAAMPLAQGYPALPVRPGTVHHFIPLGVEICRKAAHQFHPRPSQRSVPNDFWNQEELRALLNPRQMASASLYEPNALTRFLNLSKGIPFSQADHLKRVLTLELLAAATQSARRSSQHLSRR